MHVLFVEPAFPRNQREFVRGLARAGARVTGIGERSIDALDAELKGWLHAYEQVRSVVHEPSLQAAVTAVQRREWVDRLEATVEAHILPTARVRETCRIPGTSLRTAFLCRDKPAMKQALREAGVPCAQSTGADSNAEAQEFAERVGFPLIVKPRDAAGASGTRRVDSPAELEQALGEAGVGAGRSVAIEEFIEGHEGFFDTLTRDGRIVHDFASHYYPNVLEAMRERWISPQFVATNRIDAPGYQEVRAMGRRVIEALGIGTSATHMEWFFGPRGLQFSEIGCRPPGVGAWDLYCAGNEMDLYHEWARAILGLGPAETTSRRYAAGIVTLRPERDGRISGYSGTDAIFARYGGAILDHHLPPVGTPTQPVEAGYMANAWIRMRHPDYDELRRMLTHVGETLRVHAS
jgi:formate-dependent phosphoribosylglycinamide formyltransferase (GAR transformylase)